MSLSVGTGQALEKLQPSFVIKILSNLFIESNFFNFTTSVYGDVQLTLLSGGRLSASPSCGGRGRRGCSGLRLAGGLAGGLAWRLAGVTRERKGLVSRGRNVQLLPFAGGIIVYVENPKQLPEESWVSELPGSASQPRA